MNQYTSSSTKLYVCRSFHALSWKSALLAAFLLFAPFVVINTVQAAGDNTPNIVFIMADDLGYGDVGCFNPQSQIPTPNIDRLAEQGMRMTDAHAPAAVCVPTRYGLLTGCYPFRGKGSSGSRIEDGRLTLGGLLRQAGYRTGCVGKWHLGFRNWRNPDCEKPLKKGPLDRGFDDYFGIPASLDIPPYYYVEDDRCVAAPTQKIEESHSPGWSPIQGAFWRAGGIAPGFKHEEVLPKLTKKSVEFLSNYKKTAQETPFFLYVAFPAPHTPWLPLEEFRGKSGAGEYGNFVMQVDDSVGRILKTLDQLDLDENTLVFFTSDNGPVWYEKNEEEYDHRSTGVFRGMKGDAWEGGHRMPFIARWPGNIPEGTECAETICFTDMMATFSALTDQTLPDDAGEDSYNILPALLGKKRNGPIREATIHQSSRKVLAIRQGDWKLIPHLGSGGFSQPRSVKPEPGGPKGQLYNLAEDPGESQNLYLEHPKKVKQLSELLKKYKQEERSRTSSE